LSAPSDPESYACFPREELRKVLVVARLVR
jgi:hypothetical protein